MKAIRSKELLLKKLKKYSIVTDGHRYYLSDFHKTPVSRVLFSKLFDDRTLEGPNKGNCHWFERSYDLRKPIGELKGVSIFRDIHTGKFFYKHKKKFYEADSYEYAVEHINHLTEL